MAGRTSLKNHLDFSTYLSPFTWRYGSNEMRYIWSEENKRKLWRKIWVELARAQYKEKLLTKKELDDLIKYQNHIDIQKAHDIEKEIHHDLMAEIKTYASFAKIGGGKIHLGATSMDIEDNADALRIQMSLDIIEKKLINLLKELSKKIDEYKYLPCMGYTHLQAAEPITLGYRFAFYAQDVLLDLELLHFVKKATKGKGLKGAVGTSASYEKLIGDKKAYEMEQEIMEKLGISSVLIANQTAPRKLESFVSYMLSSIAQTLYKFAFDVRVLQSPGYSELAEPFGKKQVGSSAMPFKRNPRKSEQICSLTRFVIHLSTLPIDNAAHMLLERTLDDSANRRIFLPELFLAIDDTLSSTSSIVSSLVINKKQIEKNLNIHGPFSATENILMEAVKKGASRQDLHDVLRDNALKAYAHIQETGENNLELLLVKDARITRYITPATISRLLDPKTHVGLSSKRCNDILKKIQKIL